MSSSTVPVRPRLGRTGRWLALGTGLVAALFLAAVWVLPPMLDWGRFRGSIAALVGAGLGRPVQIDGDISLHLLPQPILTASDLRVTDAGDGVSMRVHEVRLRVALGPLLGGRVDARELELRGADLVLPWPPPAGALGRRPPAWITGLQARVEESRVTVGNLVLSDVSASFGSDAETGTLSAAGSASMFGLPWRMTARLGRPGRDGAATLDGSVDGQDRLRDTGGTFSGAIAADGGLAGRVTARGPDLSLLMPAPALPWRGEGRLSAADGLAVADELAVEIGGAPARGAVALRITPDLRLDLALSAGRLDLDPWIPVLLRLAQPAGGGGLPAGLDLSVQAATLAGGTLRQVRTAFDLERDGLLVREATALLPGEARFSLQGRLPRAAKGPQFEGSLSLAASDLRATLRWLEPFAPALLRRLPDTALRTADLSGKLTVDAPLLSATELRGTLDGTAAQGGLAVRLGARLGLSGSVSLDHLQLDPWMPDASLLADPAGLTRALAGAGFDADVKLQVRDADWSGQAFGPLSLDMQSEAGRLLVRRLEATAMGVHLTASGTIGEGGRVSEGRLDLSTPDASPLRAALGEAGRAVPGAALLHGPGTAAVLVSGPVDALAMRATADLADVRLEAQPVINLPARKWAGSVTLQHPGAPRLLEQLGVPGTAPWLGDGSFSLIAQAAAAPGRVDVASAEIVAGRLRASGKGSFADGALTGTVRAETLTVPGLRARSPDPLPLGRLRGLAARVRLEAGEVLVDLEPVAQGLSADLAASGDQFSATGIGALVAGGSVTGSATVQVGETPRVAVKGEASGLAVSGGLGLGAIDILSGTLGASVDLSGEGYSPAALTATLAGSGQVTVRDAVVSGFDLRAAQAALAAPDPARLGAALRAALGGGQTAFPTLSVPFQAARGVVTLQAAGDAAGGRALLDGTVDLTAGVLEGRLSMKPGASLPDVSARLTGPAQDLKRTPEVAGALRWLAERP